MEKRVGLVQLKVADKGNTNTVQQWTWPSINSTAKHPASQNPTFFYSIINLFTSYYLGVFNELIRLKST